MNKIFIALSLVMSTSVCFAQGQGRNREQRPVQIPENVFKAVLNDDKKADAVINELKMLQTVGLPLEAYVELKLTLEQKNNISELVKSSQVKMRELMQNNDRDAAMSLRQHMLAEVKSILTDEQKNIVTKHSSRNNQVGSQRDRGGRSNRPNNPPTN